MNELYFRDVDFQEVYLRVRLAAERLFGAAALTGDERVLDGFGDSARDLAHDLMKAFLDPEDESVRWDTRHGGPTTNGVVAYLVEALRHDLIDRKRSPRYRKRMDLAVPRETGEEALVVDPPDPSLDTESEAIERERWESLETLLLRDLDEHPDPDLEEYVLLQIDRSCYMGYTPREAAKRLEKPVDTIYRIKERLESRLLRLGKNAGGVHSRKPSDGERYHVTERR